MDLKKETQKNLFIVFGLNLYDKAIIFLGLIALARLLKPEDFGILAVSEILLALAGVWVEHIFETASIATSEGDDFDLRVSMAFICRTTLSLALYIILYALSGPWAAFYNNANLSIAIKILGLNMVISNLFFVPNAILTKERRFDKLSVPAMLNNSVLYGIAILLAIGGFGFWSLVLGRVITCLVSAIAFFIIRPWKIRLVWDKRIFLTMRGYVKKMYLYMFLIIFVTQVDRLLVGKILGVALTGYYTMAYSFGNWAVNNIFAVADRVAFPLYSELKNDVNLLRPVYLKFFKYILFFSTPLLTGLILFAEHFVILFLGSNWSAIILPLKILAVAGFFGLIGNISNSLLKAISRLDVEIKRNLTLAIVLPVTLIPLTIRYGLTGSCISVLISFALVQPIYFNYALKAIKMQKQEIFKSFAMILGSSLCAALLYLLCNILFLNNVRWEVCKFAFSVLTYLSAYLVISFFFLRNEFAEDIKILFQSRKAEST